MTSMNSNSHIFLVGELLLRLEKIPSVTQQVALLERELLAGARRREIAMLAALTLMGADTWRAMIRGNRPRDQNHPSQ